MTFTALGLRTLALFAFGGALMAVGSVRQPEAVRRARALKFATYFLIVHGVLALAAVGRPALLGLVTLILTVSAGEAARAWRRMLAPRPWALAFAALAVAGAAGFAASRLEPRVTAWLFLVTASFDGFAQVTGQWLGRHALAPRISPAKTVEGLLGGTVGAVGVALWLRALTPFDAPAAAALGAAIALSALGGDLTGSWTKRRAGIKDFSTLLPGQGGVLDRFNSFLAALALVGAWL